MSPARHASLLLVTALLALWPAAAAAQEPSAQQRTDELGLSVAVGLDGRSREGTWQPVAVGLEPARPVAGTLSVAVRSTATTETVQVEVAAGSRKVYRFVVPAGPVEVTFAEADAEPLTVRPGGAPVTGEYLVGVLGGLPDNLPPLRSELTGASGAWVNLDPAWVDLSAHALEVLGTIVADATDLQGLPPRAASNLAAAVSAGTDLVVVGAEPADLEGLGLPWKAPDGSWSLSASDLGGGDIPPGAGALATAFTAGAGRVVTTDVAPGGAGAGRSAAFWSLIAPPSARGQTTAGEFRVTSFPHQFGRLLAETDTETPTLPGLGAFVAVYVLVVGPINAVVLGRMGRRELAWATVPLVTALFTVGAFVGATTARPETGGAARLTYWADGAGTEFVAAGVGAPTPGVREVVLPGSDWTVRPLVDGESGGSIRREDDVIVSMTLTSLQLGGVAAWRSVDKPAPLEVEARATRGGVTVTVRNTSGGTISDVVVTAATSSRPLGTLAAGEEKSVLVAKRLPTASAYRDPFGGLPIDDTGTVGAPLSLRAVLDGEVAQGRPGMVWASGVDDGPPVGATSAGSALRDRGSMVAVGTVVTMADATLSPFAIARDAFWTPNATYAVGPEALEGDGEVFLRYRLPPGADPQQLRNQLERSGQSNGNTQLTVWDARASQWIPLDEGFETGDRSRLVGPLGEVWVRASGQMFPFEFAGRTIAESAP